MSALNVTQDEADLLLTGLKMLADVQQNAGVVADDVKALMAKLAPAPVVAVDPPDVVAAERNPAAVHRGPRDCLSADAVDRPA